VDLSPFFFPFPPHRACPDSVVSFFLGRKRGFFYPLPSPPFSPKPSPVRRGERFRSYLFRVKKREPVFFFFCQLLYGREKLHHFLVLLTPRFFLGFFLGRDLFRKLPFLRTARRGESLASSFTPPRSFPNARQRRIILHLSLLSPLLLFIPFREIRDHSDKSHQSGIPFLPFEQKEQVEDKGHSHAPLSPFLPPLSG